MDNPTNQLFDIVLPAAPPAALNYTSMLFSVLAISLIIIAIIYNAYRAGFKYKLLILLLKNELTSSSIEPRQAAYKLASILKKAHKTNRLSAFSSDRAISSQQKWQAFIVKLSNCRYSDYEIDSGDVLALLNEATSWTARVRR